MVLYFSATGNTRFLATELAQKLGDECTDLLERIKKNDLSEICSERPFIICTPVYVCEMPRFLSKYLRNVKLSGSRKVYFIADSAGYGGITGYLAKKLFRRKKMEFMGYSEVVMPRNYFISHYPPQSDSEIKERLINACRQLDDIAQTIRKEGKLKARYVFMFEKLITIPFNPVWSKYKMSAKEFFADSKCISCGKCEKVCPLNNISIRDKKPVWGSSCTHCMACIGNCPADAIEYGTVTREKGKYNFKNYRHFISGAELSGGSAAQTAKRRKNG